MSCKQVSGSSPVRASLIFSDTVARQLCFGFFLRVLGLFLRALLNLLGEILPR